MPDWFIVGLTHWNRLNFLVDKRSVFCKFSDNMIGLFILDFIVFEKLDFWQVKFDVSSLVLSAHPVNASLLCLQIGNVVFVVSQEGGGYNFVNVICILPERFILILIFQARKISLRLCILFSWLLVLILLGLLSIGLHF